MTNGPAMKRKRPRSESKLTSFKTMIEADEISGEKLHSDYSL